MTKRTPRDYELQDAGVVPAPSDWQDRQEQRERHRTPQSFAWWEIHDNLTRLGRTFVAWGWSAKDLQEFYEQPSRWTDQWESMSADRVSAAKTPPDTPAAEPPN